MKKNFITGFISGALIFSTAGVFAGQYIATENPFPVQLNGKSVSIGGYNIEGSTYFKLRDIADAVGGFTVDFNNDTIQLSKGGYVYDNAVNTIVYYPGNGGFAPDYAANFNETEVEQFESNDYSLYYHVDCTLHDYKYNAVGAYKYTQLLNSLGFQLLNTTSDEYTEKIELYGKDGNYIELSYQSNIFTVTTYPINSADYSLIADKELFYNTILALNSNSINNAFADVTFESARQTVSEICGTETASFLAETEDYWYFAPCSFDMVDNIRDSGGHVSPATIVYQINKATGVAERVQ